MEPRLAANTTPRPTVRGPKGEGKKIWLFSSFNSIFSPHQTHVPITSHPEEVFAGGAGSKSRDGTDDERSARGGLGRNGTADSNNGADRGRDAILKKKKKKRKRKSAEI